MSPSIALVDLGVLLRRHRANDAVTKALTKVLRADLVAGDDIGLPPLGRDAEGPLPAGRRRVREALHRRLLEPAIPRTRRADARHSRVCQTSGESVHRTPALNGARVSPSS